MIQLTDIQKAFGSHLVFDIDQLQLQTGITWLKGANGSGKSTFLKMLAGLLPFKGQVILNGNTDLKKNPVQYRFLVNHAEAEPSYPSFLPGSDLTEFVRSVKKGTANEVNKIKQVLGIGEWLDNPAGSYSSGMLKKLSLLMAFTGQPAWILLDEPFTTLDQASQKALCDLISQKKQEGVSFLLTSHHDIAPVDLPLNKILLLKDKKIEETGLYE